VRSWNCDLVQFAAQQKALVLRSMAATFRAFRTCELDMHLRASRPAARPALVIAARLMGDTPFSKLTRTLTLGTRLRHGPNARKNLTSPSSASLQKAFVPTGVPFPVGPS
jgi:hypothetical protein